MRLTFIKLCQIIISFLSLSLFTSGSCEPHINDISPTIVHFTMTSSTGDIISLDEDDWRIQRSYSNLISFTPAYPNPTINGIISIKLNTNLTSQLNSIYVYIQYSSDDIQRPLTVLNSIPQFSFAKYDVDLFSIVPNISQFKGKLVRLFFYDLNNTLITYGDVKID